jgi:Acetoacetate decarboxylase (ADC)
VRPRGERALPWLGTWRDLIRSRLGTYILHLPVDQDFTREAGCAIWGFPKTVQQIDFEVGSDAARCALVSAGEPALELRLPRGGSRTLPESELTTYTHIEGVAHRTRFVSTAEGFGVRLGGAELRLGSGRIADELRSLGLPRRALMSTWMEHMRARFDPPEKL